MQTAKLPPSLTILPPQSRPRNLTLQRLIYLSIAAVVLLGLLRLPQPLWGDQALFLVGGKAIQQGAILYRDFWDLKQPGIYGLFAVAGSLFGYSSVGLHIVDFLWMGTLAVTLRSTLKNHFQRPWIAELLPWLCVGSYFAAIDGRQQMQVESLAGLPIYLALWLSVKAMQEPSKRWRWLMLSGVMAGIVVLLKLVYLPLLVALWSVYLGYRLIQQRAPILPTIWQTFWPLAVGLALPIVPVILYWQAAGVLDLAVYTQLLHPPQMLKELPAKPLTNLIKAVGWNVRAFLPLIGLAGYGISQVGKRWNLLTTQLLVWLGLGLAMILAQSQSWWSYHFMLLLVPMAILAAQGIDALLDVRQGKARRIARSGLLLAVGWLAAFNLASVVDMGYAMTQSALPITPATQLRYQQQMAPRYAAITEELKFLQAQDKTQDPIYVIGDPLFYLLADRAQAVPLIGWIPELFLQSQWRELETQLSQAQPQHIFLTRDDMPAIESEFMTFLQARYGVVHSSEFGVWYERKSPMIG